MNALRPFTPGKRCGFTLVEILVALAVLSLVAVGLLQVLNFSMQTWRQGLVRTNCYIKGRTVLDAAVADIQRGVFRSDLHNFPTPASYTSPTFTFYTRSAGVGTGASPVRPISLLTYQLAAPSSGLYGYLLRSGNSIGWSSSTSNLSFLQSLTPITAATPPSASIPPNDLLCKGVAAFEMLFFLADGTTTPAKYYQSPTSSPVVMIGVAVAVIDDTAMTQLKPATTSNLTNIQGVLETAISSSWGSSYTAGKYGRSIKELWDPALVSVYQNTAYPKSLAAGFQTFERFVPCTPFY